MSNGEIIITLSDDEFKEFHNKCFSEMPMDLKIKAVNYLKEFLSDEIKQSIKNLYNKDPIFWMSKAMLHFSWGMFIRNKLRKECEILDDVLPTGNWDDYYTQCVEAACGLREIENEI